VYKYMAEPQFRFLIVLCFFVGWLISLTSRKLMKSTRSVSDLPCVLLSYDLYLQLTGILLF